MKITIGSTNPAKIGAVQYVFSDREIKSINVPSNVSAQPFSDAETREGAINRAKQCITTQPGTIGIGLEGGVMYIENDLFLCNWGALITPEEQMFTAGGARIMLPAEIEEQITKGTELGDLMDDYAKKKDVRNKDGAIGIFTNSLVSRKEMFVHIIKLLKGQLEYWH